LDFIRQICELPPEQRPKVKEAGDQALLQAARDMVRPQPRIVGGAARIMAAQRPRTQAGAARTIREALAAALKEALPAEQFEKYGRELRLRDAHRKQAALLSAVARLDALLYLTEEQRDKLVQSLDHNWQDDWEQWLQLHNYGGQYFPQIPDQHVLAHLTEEQKSVWRGVQKINVSSWNHDGRARADDGWWEGKK
jgi:hypothetical protein